MNEINMGEVDHVTAWERSMAQTDEVLHRLETPTIRAVPNSFADVLGAAIGAGNQEFRSVERLVTASWR